jgi:hypothetical protein
MIFRPRHRLTLVASRCAGIADACSRLRCLGAAVIMQWNTLPKKLQRELFDNASSMGELLETKALRGNIARFLHKHKGDEPKQMVP